MLILNLEFPRHLLGIIFPWVEKRSPQIIPYFYHVPFWGPDEPFPNSRAWKSVDRRIVCSSVNVMRRILKLQNCERARRGRSPNQQPCQAFYKEGKSQEHAFLPLDFFFVRILKVSHLLETCLNFPERKSPGITGEKRERKRKTTRQVWTNENSISLNLTETFHNFRAWNSVDRQICVVQKLQSINFEDQKMRDVRKGTCMCILLFFQEIATLTDFLVKPSHPSIDDFS